MKETKNVKFRYIPDAEGRTITLAKFCHIVFNIVGRIDMVNETVNRDSLIDSICSMVCNESLPEPLVRDFIGRVPSTCALCLFLAALRDIKENNPAQLEYGNDDYFMTFGYIHGFLSALDLATIMLDKSAIKMLDELNTDITEGRQSTAS